MDGTIAVVLTRNSVQSNLERLYCEKPPIARREALILPGPAAKAPWNTVVIATMKARIPIATVKANVAGSQFYSL